MTSSSRVLAQLFPNLKAISMFTDSKLRLKGWVVVVSLTGLTFATQGWAQALPEMPLLKTPAPKAEVPAPVNAPAKPAPPKTVKAAAQATSTVSPVQVRSKPVALPPPSKITQDFYNAFTSGNFELAEVLLGQGADVNCLNCGNAPLLNFVVDQYWSNPNKQAELVNWLAKRGANMNLQDRQEGNSALHLVLIHALMDASIADSPEFYSSVLFLIQNALAQGVSPRLADVNGVTPLHLAAKFLHITNEGQALRLSFVRRVITTLGNAGADVNAINKDGYTPLMTGLAPRIDRNVSCNRTLVTQLLDMGTNASVKAKDGKTVYDLAYDLATEGYKVCNPLLSILSTAGGSKLGSADTPAAPLAMASKPLVSLPAELVGEWKGVLRIKSPSAMAVAVTGNLGADGTVQLNAPMGVTTVGVVTKTEGSELNFRLRTVAPEGAHFKNGSRETDNFDVAGTVSNRIYRGAYVAPTDSGEFILCRQDIAAQQPDCSPTFGETISNLMGGLLGVLGGSR
jgi:ankyrin repeat protein